MPNMTLSLPEDVYNIVKTHKEVRWSEIARRAIEDYAKKIALLNSITSESELTEDDIMALDVKIKSGVQKHYKNKFSENLRHETGLIVIFSCRFFYLDVKRETRHRYKPDYGRPLKGFHLKENYPARPVLILRSGLYRD